MADDDVRTRKLEWIRDGSVWLVGLSGGALVLSATYFFEKFNQQPRAAWLLFGAWALLLIAFGAGVFTAFSTWKDLKPVSQPGASPPAAELPLGGWVANCYTVMMWSFLFGFILLVFALLINVAHHPSEIRPQKIELAVPANVQIQIIAIPAETKPPQHVPSQPPAQTSTWPAPQKTTS